MGKLKSIEINIDQPPISINHYYGFAGYRRFIKKKGLQYREEVWAAFIQLEPSKRKAVYNERIALTIYYRFPDKRKRDCDNFLKCTIDSLKGLAFEDDDQIFELHIYKELSSENPGTYIKLKAL